MIIKSIFSDAAQEVLKEAGLIKPEPKGTEGNELPKILAQSSLTLEQTIEQLSNLAYSATSENVKIDAVKTALKLHRVMESEERVPNQNIVINIIPFTAQQSQGLPSILVPRELSVV